MGDPRVVALMKQYGIWHPALIYPPGSKLAMHEQGIMAQILDDIAREDYQAETRAARTQAHEENLGFRREYAQGRREDVAMAREDRQQAAQDRAQAMQFAHDTQRAQALQLGMSDPNLTPEQRNSIKAEYMKLLGVPTAGAAPATKAKGEYGPGGAPTAAPPAPTAAGAPTYTPPTAAFAAPGGPDEFTLNKAGGGIGAGTYGPGTLGSPYGLDYYGPVNAAGQPGAATSGPWTIRARMPEGVPLPPKAYGRSFGFTDTAGLERGVASAMTADVLRQPLIDNQATALQDIGGAEAQKSVQQLLRSEPGAQVPFPSLYHPGGGSVTDANTYLPLPNEVFQPVIRSKKGGPNEIGSLLAKNPFGYDPTIDPRFAAEQIGARNPALAKQYADYASHMGFEGAPASEAEQTGRVPRTSHLFMHPVTGANVPPKETMTAGPEWFTPPTSTFTVGGSQAQPSATAAPSLQGRGEFRADYGLTPNAPGRFLDFPTTPPSYINPAALPGAAQPAAVAPTPPPQASNDRLDLLRDTDNIFYGGGQVPVPTPTPTPVQRLAQFPLPPLIPPPRKPLPA